jgi:hypothetical protein
MLINMPGIGSSVTLESVIEAPERDDKNRPTAYKRQKISAWSYPRISGGGNAEAYADVSFGPFTGQIAVTHIGLSSSEKDDGIIIMFTPIEDFVKNKQPRVFSAGEIYSVSIREEQV